MRTIHCFCLLLLASSVAAAQTPDSAARALGFNSFQHYQQSRTTCLGLVQSRVLAPGRNSQCGSNLECLKKEGAALSARQRALSASTEWRTNKCDVVAKVESQSGKSSKAPKRGGGGTHRDSYEIEVSHNDELFVINGEKFEAQTYCFNMEEGDMVIFLDGSPLGACASATLLNLRTRDKCEVWCE